MYRPFDPRCSCNHLKVPLLALDWTETKPEPITQEVNVAFMCPFCSHLEHHTYTLPRFADDVVRNVMQDINEVVTVNTWGLLGTISLNTSNPIVTQGTQYALKYLQGQGLVYEVEWATLSFRLTLLGWIALLHSGY